MSGSSHHISLLKMFSHLSYVVNTDNKFIVSVTNSMFYSLFKEYSQV